MTPEHQAKMQAGRRRCNRAAASQKAADNRRYAGSATGPKNQLVCGKDEERERGWLAEFDRALGKWLRDNQDNSTDRSVPCIAPRDAWQHEGAGSAKVLIVGYVYRPANTFQFLGQ